MEIGDFMELLLTLLSGLFIFIGTLITYKLRSDKFIDFTISTAFTVLFLLIIFSMVPEVTHHLKLYEVIACIFIGIIILKSLDVIIPHHDHDHKKDKHHKDTMNHIAMVSAFALCIHNIIEGMTIYTVCKSDLHMGIMMVLGVGLHNIPLGMVIGSSNSKNKLVISLLVSLSTIIGAFIMMIFGVSNTVILLAVTLGMIIYIALFELLPKLVCSKNKKEIVYGLVIGIVIVTVTLLLGHQH